jgi:capsular exopolysaccharide synthesis family protein
MNLSDVLALLRRRWLTFALALGAVVGASFGALAVQTPVYESTATLSLTPAESGPDQQTAISLLPQISAITPAYAEAVTAADTERLARGLLDSGHHLGGVSVATFPNAPTVLKISSRSTSRTDARLSAQAYVGALQQRVEAGEIGPRNLLRLLEIDSPRQPTTPVSPRKTLTIAVGVLIGLVVATVAAWLRDQSGGLIIDRDMLASSSGLQVFGEIPESRRLSELDSVDALLNDDRLRFASEAMRDLAVTLQLTQVGSDSVLITSPGVGQGKTTVAFGFAVSLARSGVDTLLVDGDLRRGRIEELFEGEDRPLRKHPGLADVLRGTPFRDAVQPTSLPKLHVMTSGELMEDPSVLLDAAFPQVLRDLERDGEFAVVVDATPLMPINDARIMAKFCSSTLLVVSAGLASRRDVKRALERLRLIGIAPTAAVLNRARMRDISGYGSYYLRSKPGSQATGGSAN